MNTEVLNHTLRFINFPDTPTTSGIFIFIMRYIDNFKFFSPFTKEKASATIDHWTTDMNQFAAKTAAENQGISMSEARIMWMLYKMAELETIFSNHIVNS